MDLAWTESNSDEIFKMFERYLPVVEEFIEKAESKCESVLVFCSNGQNRALCIVVTLLMKRFRWSFYKTLEFLDSKRSNLEINKNYFSSLKQTCEKFEKSNKVTQNWSTSGLAESKFVEEEMIISNTFANSKLEPILNMNNNLRDPSSFRKSKMSSKQSTGSRIVWADPLISKPKRSVKSVGKTNLKKTLQMDNPLSIEPKKNREKINLKTDVEESIGYEETINSELVRVGDNGKIKRLSDKQKLKKNLAQEFLKLKDEKVSRLLSSAGSQKVKIGSEAELFEGVGEGGSQKMANSSNEFYKKNLKDLSKKIFSKPTESFKDYEKDKSLVSKISTHSPDESRPTPNNSDNSPIQPGPLQMNTFKGLKPTQTQISSFKEKNANDIFNEMQKNSKTAYQKDDFGGIIEFMRPLKLGDPLIPKQSEFKNMERVIVPSIAKNEVLQKQIDLQNQLKNFGSDRFLKMMEEAQQQTNSKSNEKNDNPKGRLIQNKTNRPSSAPLKEEQKDLLIQKHLFFDAKIKNVTLNKLQNNKANPFFVPRPPSVQPKEKLGVTKTKLIKF